MSLSQQERVFDYSDKYLDNHVKILETIGEEDSFSEELLMLKGLSQAVGVIMVRLIREGEKLGLKFEATNGIFSTKDVVLGNSLHEIKTMVETVLLDSEKKTPLAEAAESFMEDLSKGSGGTGIVEVDEDGRDGGFVKFNVVEDGIEKGRKEMFHHNDDEVKELTGEDPIKQMKYFARKFNEMTGKRYRVIRLSLKREVLLEL